ncbi:hypothetical protein CYLTODRAFT_88118 [Cylindrobasidium torrendii FP15055 ss-10]|uniref:Uncharacterized protein n=1 Tax=Cylindrobasidium torrendii FP15055 ss-10 TaxID=1314674 RepID=A0A0D7B3D5_9AGAR|nr:hypothetical protein CYLTODRAFT_88118 [Cylindrobasidium torrendii FP15055 ss-10]
MVMFFVFQSRLQWRYRTSDQRVSATFQLSEKSEHVKISTVDSLAARRDSSPPISTPMFSYNAPSQAAIDSELVRPVNPRVSPYILALTYSSEHEPNRLQILSPEPDQQFRFELPLSAYQKPHRGSTIRHRQPSCCIYAVSDYCCHLLVHNQRRF